MWEPFNRNSFPLPTGPTIFQPPLVFLPELARSYLHILTFWICYFWRKTYLTPFQYSSPCFYQLKQPSFPWWYNLMSLSKCWNPILAYSTKAMRMYMNSKLFRRFRVLRNRYLRDLALFSSTSIPNLPSTYTARRRRPIAVYMLPSHIYRQLA